MDGNSVVRKEKPGFRAQNSRAALDLWLCQLNES